MAASSDNPIQAWFREIGQRAKIAASPRNLLWVTIFQGTILAIWIGVAYYFFPEMTSLMWPYTVGIHVAVSVMAQLITAKPPNYGAGAD